jgi:predicted dehydrogenase
MMRVAVIGAGQWGPGLIRNFHDRRRSEVRWVVDLDPARLEAVRSRFPEILVSRDAGKALGDPAVDAVVVATPTTTHFGIVRSALRSGKHVLVEKPITADSVQAEELCALAESARRVLMVGHVFLYNPSVRWVKRYLDEAGLGRVYYISAVRVSHGPVRADVNAAWDLAAHDISVVSYWLDAEPLSATAAGGSWLKPGNEDAVFATLGYPGGILLNLQSSWLSPCKVRQITVVGEEGLLTFDDMSLSEPVRIHRKPARGAGDGPGYLDSFASFRTGPGEGEIEVPRFAGHEPLKAECDHFLDCIEGGQSPLTGGRSGLAVVRALEMIERALRANGREEPVGRAGPEACLTSPS